MSLLILAVQALLVLATGLLLLAYAGMTGFRLGPGLLLELLLSQRDHVVSKDQIGDQDSFLAMDEGRRVYMDEINKMGKAAEILDFVLDSAVAECADT